MPRTCLEHRIVVPCIAFRPKKAKPKSCKNQGLEQLLRGQKKSVLQGFRQTLKNLSKINDSSAAPVPDIHVERPGQCEKQPPTVENPWENSYPATVIPCRPQFWPRPLQGFPKTFKILRKFNDSQGRARLAAANSELARLKRAVKFLGNPTENVFSTHGSFASQRRQNSRAALVALAKKKASPQKCSTLLHRDYLSACYI